MASARMPSVLSWKTSVVLVCGLAIVAAAIVGLGRVQIQASGSRDAEQQLTALRLDLAQIQDVPWARLARRG